MKITLAPSQDQSKERYPHPTVTLEVPRDDLNIGEVADLFQSAIRAYGFTLTEIEAN
jgi:hypothetical protein